MYVQIFKLFVHKLSASLNSQVICPLVLALIGFGKPTMKQVLKKWIFFKK